MSETYKKFKQTSAESRPTRQDISNSLKTVSIKTSALRFDLTSETEEPKHHLRTNQKAVVAVADFLAEFTLPFKPKLSYLGAVRNATANGDLHEGIVKVGAMIRTAMGNKLNIEFPVNIRNGSVLRPALFFWNDSPYVACQAAFDMLVKSGTLQKEVKHRRIYSPPMPEHWAPEPRRPIYNLEHMFSPGARNPLSFRRQYSKTASDKEGFGVAPMSGHTPRRAPKFLHQLPQRETPSVVDVDMDADEKPVIKQAPPPAKPVQKNPPPAAPNSAKRPYLWSQPPVAKQGQRDEDRKRVNIDEPSAKTDPSQNEVPEEMLGVAERSRDGLHEIGAHVKLTSDYEVRERGGGVITLPKGEEGCVIRDMHGDGKQLYVEFEDLGLAAVVQNNFLKSASVTEQQVENEVKELKRLGYTTIDIVEAVNRLYPDFSHVVDDLLEK